jgi:signal transduction histidine kinase
MNSQSLLHGFTFKRAAWVAVFALVAAAALSPIFKPTFLEVFGRTSFVAFSAFAAFIVAGNVRQPLIPQWIARLVALALAAPIATVVVYTVRFGGDLERIFSEAALSGILWIAGTAVGVGLLLALGYLFRERDAQARADTLSFELQKAALEKQALNAQLKVLQAQIEPHFLFNTLANVQELVEARSPQASTMLKSLIAYLRASMLRLRAENATLADELQLVRAYLELMTVRMAERLQFSIDASSAAQAAKCPPMALLTLVENAIRHGLDPSIRGGRVEISATAGQGQLVVRVADTGVGLNPHAPPGTGLANLRERLKAMYGNAAQLELAENQPHGVVATMTLPVEAVRS